MILDILKDSLEYSAQSWKTVFKVGFLIFVSFLFFPIFLVGGYSYRITSIALNGMINGEDPLPEFKNWKKMFIEGIKVFAVKFIYLLPVTIIIILGLIFKINFMVLIITSLFTGVILYNSIYRLETVYRILCGIPGSYYWPFISGPATIWNDFLDMLFDYPGLHFRQAILWKPGSRYWLHNIWNDICILIHTLFHHF